MRREGEQQKSFLDQAGQPVAKNSKVILKIPKFFKMFQNIPKYSKIFQNIPEYARTFQISIKDKNN